MTDRLSPKPKFFKYEGSTKVELPDVDSICMETPDGEIFELSFRRCDNIASLSVERGRLIIHPWAANVVRLSSIN